MGDELPPRRSTAPLIRRVLSIALLGLTAVGCPRGSTLENADVFNQACDPRPIFEGNCAGSSCHGTKDAPSSPKGGVDLLSSGVEARLLGQAASYEGIDAADLPSCEPDSPELLVNPLVPERSLLLTKLNGSHRCGDGMPLGAPLDDASIRCVRSFILALVKDGPPSGSGGTNSTGGSSAMNGNAGAGGAQ
jgi:hypothetical protein